jgi:hypothetical protein
MAKKGSKAAVALKRLYSSKNASWQYQVSSIWSINIYDWSVIVIENPRLTSNTAYFYMADNVERSIFVHFVERPRILNVIKEEKNLNWYTIAWGSMKYWIYNQPFDILWSQWA